jgi:hypothetical protein
MLQNIEQGSVIILEQANDGWFSGISVGEEPSTFYEVWNHEDTKDRGKSQDANKTELNDMNKHKEREFSKE